ncbi:hypothetical protein MRS44_003809 [Fusarium solani]|uniref:uncharacterized protein n=1 Tax=Fusarium solani TaxID=169388 RepID=UPI0032C3EEC1|nr:hypothetical protein MRS44_003809 [Fusarium solani]
MNRGVSSLVSVLQQLQTALENGNSNGLDLAQEARIDLQNILESCELVLASLKTTLSKFEHYPKELEGASTTVTKINAIKLRFRWMIEEKEVVRIRKSLDTHVQTLQLTLNATTALVTAVTKKDTTEIIALLGDLRSNLKRTATLTSATVVRPRVQTPFQSTIHHLPTPAAPQDIEAEVSPAVIVDQPANAELHSAPSFSGHQSTSIPTEPNEPGLVNFTPPTPQRAFASELTILDRESPSSNRNPSPRPKRRLPVATVPGKALFVAARTGNKNIFLQILKSGAKITEVEPDGTTVLQAAAEKNQLDVVLSLLFFGADPNLGGGQTRSPLLAATDRQHVQVVAALLEAKADPCAVHPEALPRMKSAFHSAVYHKNSEILSMLLGAGADLNVVPTLLQYACSAGTLDSVKQLLDANPDVNVVNDTGFFSESNLFGTALQVAVSLKRTEIVKCLLEHKADPNITCSNEYPWKRSPLAAAVRTQDAEILSMLLGAGADPNIAPTLLQYACSAGTLDSVKQLLDANPDVNVVNDTGFFSESNLFGTALQVAVSLKRTEIVKCLLEHKADPNITCSNEYPWKRSPLAAAVRTQDAEILSMLLGAGADPNIAPTLLQYACSAGTLDSVKQLLDANPDVNVVNDTGFFSESNLFGTALQVAVSLKRTEIVKCLLEHKADPNITCSNEYPWKRSPLAAAVCTQDAGILSMLLGAGADPNVIPGLLPYVAKNHDLQFVKMMIDEGNANVDLVDDTLGTALQVFAAKGQRDAMAYLLDLGADPNIEGGRYGSALNAAIANGHEHCIDELLGERSI